MYCRGNSCPIQQQQQQQQQRQYDNDGEGLFRVVVCWC
jgi:hypothetical protein